MIWTLDDGTRLRLITPEDYLSLPEGTALRSILGETVIIGTDYIDNDTRGGYLAYGLVLDQSEADLN